ncbi:MAG: hypothetical protein OEY14_16695 [Myxococcales bacterium]|nr:hypothetical protein [Myxococcales bacterium]
MSKLSDFMDSKKIDPRRVLAASHRVERLGHEDRSIRVAKRRVKKGVGSDADGALAAKKGRSGKPVTAPLMKAALEGGKISGAAKSRITRAVNSVLASKKASEVTLRDLF